MGSWSAASSKKSPLVLPTGQEATYSPEGNVEGKKGDLDKGKHISVPHKGKQISVPHLGCSWEGDMAGLAEKPGATRILQQQVGGLGWDVAAGLEQQRPRPLGTASATEHCLGARFSKLSTA